MKKIISFMSIAILAMASYSCVSDVMVQPEVQKKITHKLIVNASSDIESKVAIEALPDNSGYKVNWQVGDWIGLAECAPDVVLDPWDAMREYYSAELTEADILGSKASFTFGEIEDRPGENAEYTYLAYAGQGVWPYYDPWENEEDWMYLNWASMFEYTGDYIEPHVLVSVGTPIYQSPTENSFDPMADILISKPVVTDAQLTGEAQFQFGRLGAIVKITLKGLEEYAGQDIFNGAIIWGESYEVYNDMVFDPVLNKYVYRIDEETGMSVDRIEFSPSGVVVGEDGSADIWLKMPAGEINDWFRIELAIGESCLARTVDLAAISKTLTFEDGQMTVFSVSDFVLAVVEGVYRITNEVNEARDGFTASWEPVEHAVGYDCYLINSDPSMNMELTAVENPDGTWGVTVENGLPADTYSLYIKPIPAEGYGLMYDDYESHTILVGIPFTWHLSHAAFKEDNTYVEETEDYRIYAMPGYIPVSIRFNNLTAGFDSPSAYHVLRSTGPWYFYNVDPVDQMHSIELWSKNDSHEDFSVYASLSPGEESVLITGEVLKVSEIDSGSGSISYKATHKYVRYTFPTDQKYSYFTFKGDVTGVVLTNQTFYINYFE